MNQVKSVPVLTVDGPGGAGKGTICYMVAKQLGWHLLDSGALYRLTAVAAQKHGVALDNEESVSVLAKHLDVQFVPQDGGLVNTILEGEDVSHDIRTEEVGAMASKVAALPQVRQALLERQRDFAQAPGVVADGRDMGTVVFPDAPFKVFLTASAQARAERRFQQLKAQGEDVRIAHLLKEIEERDARDMGRKAAPLKAADDAVTIDTTAHSIEKVLENVLAIVSR